MSIDFGECLYLNGEKDNAASMLDDCINGSDDLAWPCAGQESIDKGLLSRNLERPSGDNVGGNLHHSLNSKIESHKKDNIQESQHGSNVEGFTNMGEHYVKPGDCPDGYYWNQKLNKCKQVCMNCKYNERTHSKSKEFNEFDPCFPNRGVYNGITNKGVTKCTCGEDGQYCNEMFDAQGGMFVDKTYIMNVGDYGTIGDLSAY